MLNGKIHYMTHPLIKHKISMLRNENTPTSEFRRLVREISLLIGFEATQNLSLKSKPVKTPLETTNGEFVETPVLLVPILRAGLGMVDALLELMPFASTGHIGLYRDHQTKEPVEYYCKLPPNADKCKVFVLDPMLATGGSAAAAITMLKKRGIKDITMLNIVSAPQGEETLTKAHPDVDIYIGVHDRDLNENAYILPGLGDAGDRLFGTL